MTDDDQAAARRRTAEARAILWSTLSGQKVSAADADTGTEIEYIQLSSIVKLNAAKKEMRNRLAGIPIIKQNAGGIKSVTEDSSDTNLEPGQAVYDGGYQVTCRGRTLEQLLADQDVPTPIPAITSRQTQGQSDWSPSDAQDTDYSEDEEFDPDEESASILAMYTGSDGRVRKHASKHFLTVNGSGTQAGDYSIILSRMNKVSMQPEYFDKFLDEAFAVAAGRDSGQKRKETTLF